MHQFEVSISKKSLLTAFKPSPRIAEKSVRYHPILKTISPDPHFNWEGVFFPPKREVYKTVAAVQKNGGHRIVPISMDLVSKLGARVLRNRQLCLGGKALQGIFLPKNLMLQHSLIKRFLVWFSPCIKVKRMRYTINKYCFDRREYEFLRMYSVSLGYPPYLVQRDWYLRYWIFLIFRITNMRFNGKRLKLKAQSLNSAWFLAGTRYVITE